jgi:hypothetical protein
MFAEALAQIEPWRQIGPSSSWMIAMQAYVYGRSGDLVNAQRAVQQLQETGRTRQLDPLLLACAYVGMNDKDKALFWIEKAIEARSSNLTSLKVSPMFDSLHGDPRFDAALRKMNFTR